MRQEIYLAASAGTGMTAQILEKDVWVCWTLEVLFSNRQALPMAFKGGTSLSKVYNVISRFSEDVDITIDYQALDNTIDPLAPGTSRKARDRFRERLNSLLAEHIREVVAPSLRAALAQELGLGPEAVELDDSGPENLFVNYPSAFDGARRYLANRVHVEFGGRNSILPREAHVIEPYLRSHTTGLSFPKAHVQVLAAERTFWEKATLIHAACNRPPKYDSARQSRHWYDLDCLARSDIGDRALAQRDLLGEVVRLKKAFFNSATADYDACLGGHLRLIPEGRGFAALARDYANMFDAGMFLGNPPRFEDLMSRLATLESSIND